MKLLAAGAAVALLMFGSGAQEKSRPVTTPLGAEEVHALQVQVMLARAGFSPGEIDASMGTNTRQAFDAYQKSGGDPRALPQKALVDYTITEEDAATRFTPRIPDDLERQAQLPALGYRDMVEMLGERFHSSPSLVRRMNPQSRFGAGETIRVPDVPTDHDPTQPARKAQASGDGGAGVTITVTRSTSTLTVNDRDGKPVFFAPVTTGSEHDPLPIGQWKVTGVQYAPSFHYNPELFWDADPAHSKAVIQPGPNNPVGVVWIDIDRPHYGLHGTPEPSTVGKTTSHGCVRLTNWDALTVASFARPGTPVIFAE